ncbi:MAG TPA: family 78 glycoside hydrolase catalytic domain [Acidimicrobiales bacterium]
MVAGGAAQGADVAGTPPGALQATRLTCQRLIDPLGVDEPAPVFGWTPVASRGGERQVAYQVLVASDPALLAPGRADRWDSGRVGSSAVAGVAYGGVALGSRERCWWTVRLWDRDGEVGEVAAPATFEMGLLEPDDWAASWIAGGGPGSVLLRRAFTVDRPVARARAYVSGLGHYELRLNGAKCGDRVLDPPTTTYDHDPELLDAAGRPARIRSPRVPYVVHDITDRVRPGANVVGLVLGNGWFSFADEPHTGLRRPWADRPRALAQLEVDFRDGSRLVVASDASWTVGTSPIVHDDPVHGERYDARLEQPGWDEPGFDDAGWEAATLVDGPGGALRCLAIEPTRVIETRPPVAVRDLPGGVRIFDFGQHVSGWTRIVVSGPPGAEVTLRHAGELHEDGTLDDRANMAAHSTARQTNVYVLGGPGGPGGSSGSGDTTSASGPSSAAWEPRFTLHGFRYVELAAPPDVHVEAVEARVVHSDVAASGRFRCANELLNRIDENVRWTYRASFQGYPQDAADRSERIGWLGDPGWIIEDFLYTFDTHAYWAKWLDDIRDTQLPDGSVPIATPIHWRGSTNWDVLPRFPYAPWPDFSVATYVVIAWHVYRFHGDRALLERHYDSMWRALDWAVGLADDGILGAGFGDHMEPLPDGTCTPIAQRTPVALTSTAWLYAMADIVASAAQVLGDASGAAKASDVREAVRKAFDARFFDPAAARYATGSQTALALPLWLGLVPEEHRAAVARNLVDDIVGRDGRHLATGTMGTAALEQVLGEIGAAGVMYDIATQDDFPGWGYQVAQGATTVWETWGHAARSYPEASRNMKLLAAVSVFLYRDVAGLACLAPAWELLRIRPAVTDRLAHAEACVRTVRGDAAVAWWRGDGPDNALEVEIVVPDTSRADVWLPMATDGVVTAGADDRQLWPVTAPGPRPQELRHVRWEDGFLRFEAGGGTHRFRVTGG